MTNLFNKIKYFILSNREKKRREQINKVIKPSYSNKTSKHIIGSAADVTLNAQTNNIVEEVKKNASAIADKTNCNPQELLEYIKATKTPVYKINNADKLLAYIKEEEGLIYEQEGLRALYISLITGSGISFKTPVMFILREGEIDKYYMLHNFYRWCSLKAGLPGFEYKTQQKFKKYLNGNPDIIVKSFSMEDILSVKEAIARDQEATDFAISYTKRFEGSKKVLDKIKNEGGANI